MRDAPDRPARAGDDGSGGLPGGGAGEGRRALADLARGAAARRSRRAPRPGGGTRSPPGGSASVPSCASARLPRLQRGGEAPGPGPTGWAAPWRSSTPTRWCTTTSPAWTTTTSAAAAPPCTASSAWRSPCPRVPRSCRWRWRCSATPPRRSGSSRRRGARLVVELCRAAGAGGMVGGQLLDLEGESRAVDAGTLEGIHRAKTGALLTASLRIGAIAGGAAPRALRRLTAYGEALGLAFQIMDDVLDVVGDRQALGKTAGRDGRSGRRVSFTLRPGRRPRSRPRPRRRGQGRPRRLRFAGAPRPRRLRGGAPQAEPHRWTQDGFLRRFPADRPRVAAGRPQRRIRAALSRLSRSRRRVASR